MRKYAIIVAGGKGLRMNAAIPKQFLPLLGLPVVCHAIQAFAYAIRGINIILVVPSDQLDSARTIMKSYLGNIDVTTVAGGETRYESVQNGLKMVKDDGVVFVHDGVRPLVNAALIERCYIQAQDKGSAIPVIPVNDSIRIMDEEGASSPVDRSKLRIVQTPQTFRTEIIIPAFTQSYNPSFTDEATVVEAFGTKVYLVEGDRDNIKLTTQGDMFIAESLLKVSA
jgi:2-C-methyl-D-erythritol 4-phosphate cytidylyltransferase